MMNIEWHLDARFLSSGFSDAPAEDAYDVAFCLDTRRGDLLAKIWHDGYGKFFTDLYLPLFTFLRLKSQGHPMLVRSLRAFPRVHVELLRHHVLEDACLEAADLLGCDPPPVLND
jgi:hypothetical protein